MAYQKKRTSRTAKPKSSSKTRTTTNARVKKQSPDETIKTSSHFSRFFQSKAMKFLAGVAVVILLSWLSHQAWKFLGNWQIQWQSPLTLAPKKQDKIGPITSKQSPGYRNNNKNGHLQSLQATKSMQRDFYIYLYRLTEESQDFPLVRVKRSFRRKPEDCGKYFQAVYRTLTRGPLSQEKKQGLDTALPDDMAFLGLRCQSKDKLLILNMDKNFANDGGNILRSRLKQLVYTFTGFSEVSGLVLLIEGKHKSALTGDGVVIPKVLTRHNLP